MIDKKDMRISDIVHGTIHMSDLERRIVSTAQFNRLHYISQTSTVYLTYPSNNCKRFDHSIGTCYLCGNMFYYGICNASAKTLNFFFGDIKSLIKDILTEWSKNLPANSAYKKALGDCNCGENIYNTLPKKVYDDLYNQFYPLNVKPEDLTYYFIVFQAIRISALLHDIGHPPFSHIVENAMQSAYYSLKSTDSECEFVKAMNRFFQPGRKDLHEEIGRTLFDDIESAVLDSYDSYGFDEVIDKEKIENYTHDQMFDILSFYLSKLIISDGSVNKNLEQYAPLMRELHRIIDGALDGDRLDNVNRDAFFTGLGSYGIIDYTRIINNMVLCGNSTDGFLFCPAMKCLDAVEDVFLRRWKNYKYMTHHHKVIKTNFMLEECVRILCIKYTDDLSGESDPRLSKALPYDISGLWKPLIKGSSDRENKVKFVQWNDHWLLSVLQKEYLEFHSGKVPRDADSMRLRYFLEEIIESKKYYSSIIKRYEDFIEIDKRFAAEFLKRTKKLAPDCRKKIKTIEQDVTIDGDSREIATKFLKEVLAVHKSVVSWNTKREEGFLCSEIIDTIGAYKKNLSSWLAKEMTSKILEKFKSEIEDCFIVFQKLKIGTDKLLELVDTYSEGLLHKPFTQITYIESSLNIEKHSMPAFYIYIKSKKDGKKLDLNELKKELGITMADSLNSVIKEVIDENKFSK